MEGGGTPVSLEVPALWREWVAKLRETVHERNDYLRRLQSQRAYLDGLIEGAPEAIVLLDADDRDLHCVQLVLARATRCRP